MASSFALIGASGRVAQAMISASAKTTYDWNNVPQQWRSVHRVATSKIIPWDGLSETSKPLKIWMDKFGTLDALVVLAGVTPATASDMNLNTSIAQAYLHAAIACNIPRVILASSSAVYGAGQGDPLKETDPCLPLNDYGRSKLDMENFARTQVSTQLEICNLRIGNIAGADALLLNAAKAKGVPLQIDRFENKRGPLRSYMAPKHLANVLTQLATSPKPLPFILNVAGEHPVYMEDLATAAQIPWEYKVAHPSAQSKITLSTLALSEFVDFPADSGIPRVIVEDWLRNF